MLPVRCSMAAACMWLTKLIRGYMVCDSTHSEGGDAVC